MPGFVTLSVRGESGLIRRNGHITRVDEMGSGAKENWSSGSAYEQYVGRWSRRIAAEFIDWLDVAPGLRWADVGCGTGALTGCILGRSQPAAVCAVDQSAAYVAEARKGLEDARVQLETGDACAMPWPAGSFDATVSGLVLNFVPDPEKMASEMVRVTRPGGKVALYVWDYRDGMQMMRHFWDVAQEQSPGDAAADEAKRFPLCQPEPLTQLFKRSGLASVAVRAIEVPTVFRDFDDYWQPFLGRQGAAPAYLASLPSDTQGAIRDSLKARLGADAGGAIAMTARAWAVRGVVPAA